MQALYTTCVRLPATEALCAKWADAAIALLDDATATRLRRKRRTDDRLRGAVSSLLLLQSAGVPPERMRLTHLDRHAQGRPILPPSGSYDANSTHHGNWVCCAELPNSIGGRRVGVDVLDVAHVPGKHALPAFSRYLAPEEAAFLQTLDGRPFQIAFAALWTLKEALVKVGSTARAWPGHPRCSCALCPWPRMMLMESGGILSPLVASIRFWCAGRWLRVDEPAGTGELCRDVAARLTAGGALCSDVTVHIDNRRLRPQQHA